MAANVGFDYEWFRGDQWEIEEANKIQDFFSNIDSPDYRIYTIDGIALEEKILHSVGLMATNAMASLAGNGPKAKDYVNKFWELPLRTGERRYYDNCLYFFSVLALSGRYRVGK